MNVKEFDEFIKNNYRKLLNDALSITQHYDYSTDIVNDTYIKIRNRIELSGFTGNVYGYFWMSVSNEWRVLCNRKKIRKFVELDIEQDSEANSHGNNNHTSKIKYNDREHAEQVLLQNEEWDKIEEEYFNRIMWICNLLYNWIEVNYDDREAYLFKTYFKHGDTYEELSIRTGIDKPTISRIIKPIKRRLREEFQDYINKQIKR